MRTSQYATTATSTDDHCHADELENGALVCKIGSTLPIPFSFPIEH
jgi:hypothetical protein